METLLSKFGMFIARLLLWLIGMDIACLEIGMDIANSTFYTIRTWLYTNILIGTLIAISNYRARLNIRTWLYTNIRIW